MSKTSLSNKHSIATQVLNDLGAASLITQCKKKYIYPNAFNANVYLTSEICFTGP